jgi:hypothetical protein
MMCNMLNQHLHINNILLPEQFGFRKGTIQQAVFTLTDTTLSALNQRQQVGSIFSDLCKAFDYINHKTLIHKFYGLHRVNIKWFESYLTGRTQRVDITSLSY